MNPQNILDTLKKLTLLVLAFLCVYGFYAMKTMYAGYVTPYHGLVSVPIQEIQTHAWIALVGLCFVILLSKSLWEHKLGSSLLNLFDKAVENYRAFLFFGSLLLLLQILFVQHFVLMHAPICDDENVYVFMAQTLLKGRLVNPSPFPENPSFFWNQFILLDDKVWYGKYPIGHSLFLALGELFNARFWVMPIMSVLALWLTFAVGEKLFNRKVAILSVFFLALSPQFVFSGATLLSQVTSGFLLLVIMWAVLQWETSTKIQWLVLACFSMGLAVLVRPLPCIFYIPAVGLYVLFRMKHISWNTKWKQGLLGLVVLVLWAGVFVGINMAQTGRPLLSAHQKYHYNPQPKKTTKAPQLSNLTLGMGIFSERRSVLYSSIFGALQRQSMWFLGFPLLLLFLLLVPMKERGLFLWLMIASVYAYRVLVPKTVVSSTGPVYVLEVVPLLAIAIAKGIQVFLQKTREIRFISDANASLVLFSVALSCFLFFVPTHANNLFQSSFERQRLYRMLKEKEVKNALVFTNILSPGSLTWAYYPQSPDPDLKENILFVRQYPNGQGLKEKMALWRLLDPQTRQKEIRKYQRKMAQINYDFWKKKFPNRKAWVSTFIRKGEVTLSEVEAPEDFMKR